MKLLALDTVSSACSVALQLDDQLLDEHFIQPQGHSELLIGMIDKLLAEAGVEVAQLDAIAFGRGPGSFTGLRIGAAVTQGLAWAVDIPVIPVSSLATVAQGVIAEQQAQQVLVAMDARMHEVYWAAYQQHEQELHLLGEEQVCPPADTPLPASGEFIGAGDGWRAYADVLTARHQPQLCGVFEEALPQARHMLTLAAREWQRGNVQPADQALPVYLRDKVAEKAKRP